MMVQMEALRLSSLHKLCDPEHLRPQEPSSVRKKLLFEDSGRKSSIAHPCAEEAP